MEILDITVLQDFAGLCFWLCQPWAVYTKEAPVMAECHCFCSRVQLSGYRRGGGGWVRFVGLLSCWLFLSACVSQWWGWMKEALCSSRRAGEHLLTATTSTPPRINLERFFFLLRPWGRSLVCCGGMGQIYLCPFQAIGLFIYLPEDFLVTIQPHEIVRVISSEAICESTLKTLKC